MMPIMISVFISSFSVDWLRIPLCLPLTDVGMGQGAKDDESIHLKAAGRTCLFQQKDNHSSRQ